MTSETARLHKIHSPVRAASGPASYGDAGGPGRPVRSAHGLGSGSYPWRYPSEPLGGQRLPHGHTPI